MGELTDAEVAELYDAMCPWDPATSHADAFYHELVMASRDVLDVGCGTGSMLHNARASGHAGRLVGVDPDVAALARARRRSDIEWVEGKAADMTWSAEFDLAVMASHAFQVFISDDDLRASLVAIRNALRLGGRFAFETRNPQARAWETWATSRSEVTARDGRVFTVTYDIASVIDGVVTLSEVYSDPDGTRLRADEGQLRFLDRPTMNSFLVDAGFSIDEQSGDFERSPIADGCDEIVTIARRIG